MKYEVMILLCCSPLKYIKLEVKKLIENLGEVRSQIIQNTPTLNHEQFRMDMKSHERD